MEQAPDQPRSERVISKAKFEPKLNLSHWGVVKKAGDRAEACRAQCRSGCSKLRCVGYVEEFTAKLGVDLQQVCILDDGEILRPGWRAGKNVSPRASIGSGRVRYLRKGRRVKPQFLITIVQSARFDSVRSVASPRGQDALRLRDSERHTGVKNGNTTQFPASPELLLTKRHCVIEADGEIVANVKTRWAAVTIDVVGIERTTFYIGDNVGALAEGVSGKEHEVVREALSRFKL